MTLPNSLSRHDLKPLDSRHDLLSVDVAMRNVAHWDIGSVFDKNEPFGTYFKNLIKQNSDSMRDSILNDGYLET